MATAGRFSKDDVVPFWINGAEVTASNTFDVLSPVDSSKLYACSAASLEHVEDAVKSASAAFPSWSKTSPSTRRDIFLRCANIFERRAEELNAYCKQEIAAGQMFLDFSTKVVVEGLRATAGDIYRIRSSVIPTEDETASMLIQRVPYGVVLSISSWNGPYPLGFRAILQPLIAGNTIVFKGHEFAPATTWAIASAFKEAGLPDGVLNTLYHTPSDALKITEALIASPAVRKLNFTGSSATGRRIAALAGSHLVPCVLELGGKSPAIVLEDANVQLAAMQVALGAFFHAGQVCMSTERVIVAESIAQEFQAALKGTVATLFPGEGQQMINARAARHGLDLTQDAIKNGANVVLGDAQDTQDTNATSQPPATTTTLNGSSSSSTLDRSSGSDSSVPSSTALKPIILSNISPASKLYHTESFAPSLALFTVTSDEQAIALANDTFYGLAASVFSRDLRRAMRIADRLDVGNVRINGMTIQGSISSAHGGVKGSGYGVMCGEEGLAEWTTLKVVTYDH